MISASLFWRFTPHPDAHPSRQLKARKDGADLALRHLSVLARVIEHAAEQDARVAYFHLAPLFPARQATRLGLDHGPKLHGFVREVRLHFQAHTFHARPRLWPLPPGPPVLVIHLHCRIPKGGRKAPVWLRFARFAFRPLFAYTKR